MPTTTTKQVRANTYLYFTYYDATDKKKKEVYCGLEDDPKSIQKAIKLEKNYLKKQKNELKLKIHNLEERLNQIS